MSDCMWCSSYSHFRENVFNHTIEVCQNVNLLEHINSTLERSRDFTFFAQLDVYLSYKNKLVLECIAAKNNYTHRLPKFILCKIVANIFFKKINKSHLTQTINISQLSNHYRDKVFTSKRSRIERWENVFNGRFPLPFMFEFMTKKKFDHELHNLIRTLHPELYPLTTPRSNFINHSITNMIPESSPNSISEPQTPTNNQDTTNTQRENTVQDTPPFNPFGFRRIIEPLNNSNTPILNNDSNNNNSNQSPFGFPNFERIGWNSRTQQVTNIESLIITLPDNTSNTVQIKKIVSLMKWRNITIHSPPLYNTLKDSNQNTNTENSKNNIIQTDISELRIQLNNDILNYFKKNNDKINITQVKTSENENDDFCPICYDNVTDSFINCSHHYCITCLFKTINSKNIPICAICRTNITSITPLNSHSYNSLTQLKLSFYENNLF